MVWQIIAIVRCWSVMALYIIVWVYRLMVAFNCMLVFTKFVMWNIIVVMMYWNLMALLMVIMFIVVVSWMNSIKHVVVRLLNGIVWVMVHWLNHHGLMMRLRVDVVICLVVNWMLQMHLFVMDGV